MPLPWKFYLSTTVDVYSRRGYTDSRLNTDDVIWSASLSRSILKGCLNFRLEAFDILGQINRTSYTINAQMQTETWRNVLGRYVMLHITYRLQLQTLDAHQTVKTGKLVGDLGNSVGDLGKTGAVPVFLIKGLSS